MRVSTKAWKGDLGCEREVEVWKEEEMTWGDDEEAAGADDDWRMGLYERRM